MSRANFVEEDEAVRLLKSGDLDSFFTYIAPLVEASVHKNKFDALDHEDLYQEAYMKIFKNISWYDPSKGSIRAFISGVAFSAAYTYNQNQIKQLRTFNGQIEPEVFDYFYGDEDPERNNFFIYDLIRLLRAKEVQEELSGAEKRVIRKVVRAMECFGVTTTADIAKVIGHNHKYTNEVLRVAGKVIKDKGLL